MPVDFFYSIPNSKLLLLFVGGLVILSLGGMYIFDQVIGDGLKSFDNGDTGTYISIVSIATALIIAFIVSNEWQAYSKNKESLTKEAGTIYVLIKTLEHIKNSEKAMSIAKKYLNSIITDEFDQMKTGKLEQINPYLDELQPLIYGFKSSDSHDQTLSDKSIDLLNTVILFRRERLEMSITGTPRELWWMLSIGFSMIIMMTWFLNGNMLYRVSMTTFVAITYASMLFLAIALDFPFKGEFGLAPTAFELIQTKLSI